MKIYISGGCSNGKTETGENLVLEMADKAEKETGVRPPVYYVATMIPKDREDRRKIDLHREERKDKGFTTLEKKSYIRMLPHENPEGIYFVDSITALLENAMFDGDANVDINGWQTVVDDVMDFMGQVESAVFVSDSVFSDGTEYDPVTESYRRNLAICDRIIASECDRVLEVTFGNVIEYKNKSGKKK